MDLSSLDMVHVFRVFVRVPPCSSILLRLLWNSRLTSSSLR